MPNLFDSDTGKKAAAARWAKPRDAKPSADADAQAHGESEGALQALRAVMASKAAPHAAVVAAARALLDHEAGSTSALPTAAIQVHEATDADLHRWVAELAPQGLGDDDS